MGKIILNEQTLMETSGAPNIRYNPETDMVQCYFEGEWVDWKLASVAWDGYLYKYGVGISKYGFSGGEISNSAMSFGWSAPGSSASAWGYRTYTTKTKFDVTNYKSLILDSALSSDSSYDDTIVVGLSDNNSSNSSMTKRSYRVLTQATRDVLKHWICRLLMENIILKYTAVQPVGVGKA